MPDYTLLNTYLDVHEAAQQLQVHPETIRRMIRRGDLKAIRVGLKKEFRVYQASIDAYIERNTVEVETE